MGCGSSDKAHPGPSSGRPRGLLSGRVRAGLGGVSVQTSTGMAGMAGGLEKEMVCPGNPGLGRGSEGRQGMPKRPPRAPTAVLGLHSAGVRSPKGLQRTHLVRWTFWKALAESQSGSSTSKRVNSVGILRAGRGALILPGEGRGERNSTRSRTPRLVLG